MKRIIIAVSLFLICITGAVVEVFSVSGSVTGYIKEIETVDKLVKKGNMTTAAKKCRELESRWDNTARIIDAVLIHDYVDQISIDLSQMRAHIESGNKDSYFAGSEQAKKALMSIKSSEYPTIENIL